MRKHQRMRKTRNFILCSYLAVFSVSADVTTGQFSSCKYDQDSGDITGVEVHIVPNPIGFSFVAHGSEGAPGFPEVYDLEEEGDSMTVTIPSTSRSGMRPCKYQIEVSSEALVMRCQDFSYTVPRKATFWQ